MLYHNLPHLSGGATLRRILFSITLLVSASVLGFTGMMLPKQTLAIGSWDINTSDADLVYAGSDIIELAESSQDMDANQESKEPAKYSFASAQGASELRLIPGGEVEGEIFFYNVDGNRITHITMEINEESQIPEGWEVEIDPPLHETEVIFGGQSITIAENLHIEPTDIASEEVKDIPQGMACLTLSDRGYVLARVATITIRVPESEKVSTNSGIKVTAVASWLGQAGEVTIKQTRDFNFQVTTCGIKDQ